MYRRIQMAQHEKIMENCKTHNIFKKTFKIFVAETSLTLTITVFVSHRYWAKIKDQIGKYINTNHFIGISDKTTFILTKLISQDYF